MSFKEESDLVSFVNYKDYSGVSGRGKTRGRKLGWLL